MFDFEKNYWNGRYAAGYNSGYGSYGTQLEHKLAWLRDLDVNSISEIGCGDFNLGRRLLDFYPHAKYVGQDISDVIISQNIGLSDPLQAKFTTNIDELPPADLLLCIDVLFHVIDDMEAEVLLKKIESKWTKYLAITAYERDEELTGHVRIRRFDYLRFGKPIIRDVVEEDGQLYFYLFKRDSVGPERPSIDLSKVTACLMTKDATYPSEILNEIKKYPFGEVLILTNSDSPYNKHKLFAAAKNDLIYYQDDDAICPIGELAQRSNPEMINLAIKPEHYEQYKATRMTMGLGWGAIFPKSILKSLDRYIAKYGEDAIYKRETERILTYLNYPQNRFVLPITDLPSAWAPDRLWRQPQHYDNIKIVEERCASLVL